VVYRADDDSVLVVMAEKRNDEAEHLSQNLRKMLEPGVDLSQDLRALRAADATDDASHC